MLLTWAVHYVICPSRLVSPAFHSSPSLIHSPKVSQHWLHPRCQKHVMMDELCQTLSAAHEWNEMCMWGCWVRRECRCAGTGGGKLRPLRLFLFLYVRPQSRTPSSWMASFTSSESSDSWQNCSSYFSKEGCIPSFSFLKLPEEVSEGYPALPFICLPKWRGKSSHHGNDRKLNYVYYFFKDDIVMGKNVIKTQGRKCSTNIHRGLCSAFSHLKLETWTYFLWIYIRIEHLTPNPSRIRDLSSLFRIWVL